MKVNVVKLGSVLMCGAFLTGCSNQNAIYKLSAEVQRLNYQLDPLYHDLQLLRKDIQITKYEAARAHQRLDEHDEYVHHNK